MTVETTSRNCSSSLRNSASKDAMLLVPDVNTLWEASRHDWQRLIDDRLITWGSNPDQLADIGVDHPSLQVIDKAVSLARRLQQYGFHPPDSVVPDANGGIVFERCEQDVKEVFHIRDNGRIEYQQRLVERTPL